MLLAENSIQVTKEHCLKTSPKFTMKCIWNPKYLSAFEVKRLDKRLKRRPKLSTARKSNVYKLPMSVLIDVLCAQVLYFGMDL